MNIERETVELHKQSISSSILVNTFLYTKDMFKITTKEERLQKARITQQHDVCHCAVSIILHLYL